MLRKFWLISVALGLVVISGSGHSASAAPGQGQNQVTLRWASLGFQLIAQEWIDGVLHTHICADWQGENRIEFLLPPIPLVEQDDLRIQQVAEEIAPVLQYVALVQWHEDNPDYVPPWGTGGCNSLQTGNPEPYLTLGPTRTYQLLREDP